MPEKPVAVTFVYVEDFAAVYFDGALFMQAEQLDAEILCEGLLGKFIESIEHKYADETWFDKRQSQEFPLDLIYVVLEDEVE